MTLSQEILKALDEVERVKKIGSSELARRARARVRKQLGTTLVKLTINDLLKVVKNRKELLGTSMGEMRKTVLQRVVPNERSKSLIFQGSAYGKKQYKPQLTFYSVDFAMEKDKKHPLSASIKDDDVGTKIIYVEQVKANTHPVQCRCDCKDFSFRFGWADKSSKVLSGPNTYAYTRKTLPPPEGYPYANPGNHSGFCKHLFTLIELLQKRKLLI